MPERAFKDAQTYQCTIRFLHQLETALRAVNDKPAVFTPRSHEKTNNRTIKAVSRSLAKTEKSFHISYHRRLILPLSPINSQPLVTRFAVKETTASHGKFNFMR